MMKKKTTKLLALCLATALALLSTGCGGTASTPAASGKPAAKDFTLVVGLDAAPEGLDLALYRNRTTETVVRNMFDGLVTRTPDMKIVPEIAESWSNPSPTVWEFKLRQGITFHNGEVLNADDVVFTYERILNPGAINGQSSPRLGLVGPLQKVEKIDDYNVRFTLKEPWPVFLAMLPHQVIVPKDYIKEKGDAHFSQNPVGAGPFKFVSAKLSEEIVLERYDNYYGGAKGVGQEGPAPAKRVIFKVIPEPSTRLAALQSGDIHIAQNISSSMVAALKQNSNVQVKTCDGTNLYYLGINVKNPTLSDVKVRQAIAHGINMEQIAKTMMEGYATPLKTPVLPASFAVNKEIAGYPYDVAKAKALLAEAGKTNFPLVIDCEPPLKEVAEAAAIQLREIGIDASVRTWEWGVLKPLLVAGERQLVFNNWGNSTLDPYDALNPMFMTGGRGNYTLYSNPQVDKLLEEAGVMNDQAARKVKYDEVQKILHSEVPFPVMYTKQDIAGCTAAVRNWQPSPDGRINLHDVELAG